MKTFATVLIAAGATAGFLLRWPPPVAEPLPGARDSVREARLEPVRVAAVPLAAVPELPAVRAERGWTAKELDAAIDRVAALENDDERKLAAADVVAQLAQSDPATAIDVADVLDIGRDDGTLERLTQVWAEERLPEALRWVRSQPAGMPRDQLLARVALVQAARDPARAAILVTQDMSPGALQRDAAMNVVRAWAVRDPDAATEWVSAFPDASTREQGRVLIRLAGREAH